MYRAQASACVILIVAIGVLWFMIDQRTKEIGQLNGFAAAGNSETPRIINEFTRLDLVSVDIPAVVFHYTILLPTDEVDVAALRNQELSWFLNVACKSKQVQSMVLKPGYEIVRSYKDESQKALFSMRLGIDQCQDT